MRPSKYLVGLIGLGIMLAFSGLFVQWLFYVQLAYNLAILFIVLIDLTLSPRPGSFEISRSVNEKQYLRMAYSVNLVLWNKSRTAVTYEVYDHIPLELTATQSVFRGKINPAEKVSLQYEITPAKRGEYRWPGISFRYYSLLKLLLFYRNFPLTSRVKVYPNVKETSRYYLLSRIDKLSAMGIRTVKLPGTSKEFESLRDYVRGDDWRQIDWKATAHRQKLTVKNYEAEKNQRVILAIDSGRLMSTNVAGSNKLDYAINSALILAYIAISKGDRVGVCLFSNRVHLFIPPEKYKKHIDVITEGLYNARYDFYETNHARCLNHLAVKHKKRSLIIMLSDFADIDTSEEMTSSIINSARKNIFVYVGVRDPFIQTIARQFPADTLSAYHKAVAINLENDRIQVLETLKHQGVHVLDCMPDQITAPMINKYLELTKIGAL